MDNNELTILEKHIIQRCIFLPMIRIALEQDKKIIALTNTKFKAQYLEALNLAVLRVTEDMRKNKDDLFDHHIHMTRRTWLDYEVYTRGHVFKISYQKSVAGDWIYERVRQYLTTE
ncbi:hypothetical protein [Sporolactobacillus pectinivorans]|uniref:hypothetical protein n=1 Tax=Sporolactobacillus pectinivorans TaxID=1591408 RepID=UPI000C26A6AD|nr:hypothetical protein [Sporolactobacillus pectinivorans]